MILRFARLYFFHPAHAQRQHEYDSQFPQLTPNTKMIMIPNLVGSKINWRWMREKLAELNRSDVVLFEDSCDCMTCTHESDVSAISFYASHIITML